MDREKTNWSAKIVNATPAQLVLIIYEIIFESIDESVESLAQKDFKGFEHSLERARDLLGELVHDLKMQNKIEYDFLSLYMFVNKLLVQGYCRRDKEILNRAKKILVNLYDGLKEAEKQVPKDEKVIRNAQQIYAGLTYGKGTLNESVAQDLNRGFKA